MRDRFFVGRLQVLGAVWLFVCVGAWAQGSQSGILTGAVIDHEGKGLMGATVTVTCPAIPQPRTVVTGPNGGYVVRGLPPGVCEASFALDDMATIERQLTISVGRTVIADARLEAVEFEHSIVVVGETGSPLDDSQRGLNLTADAVDVMPIDRAPLDVAKLAPGVTDRTVLQQISIGGGPGYDNLIMVDGVDIGFGEFGNTSGPFAEEVGLHIEEAIEETQIVSSSISAEFGRFSGGVVNVVTKRGGKRLRGSFRVDLSNASWREETPLESELEISRKSNLNEVYSATVGGPILQDHLWFFLAAGQTSRSDRSILPVTNVPRPDSFENQRFEIKLTGYLVDKHTIELVAFNSDSRVHGLVIDNQIDPRAADTYELPHSSRVARYSGVIADNLLVEARYAWREFTTSGLGGDLPDPTLAPFIDPASGFFYNGPWLDESDPILDFEDEQLAASVGWYLDSKRVGSHDLKLGFERFETVHRGGLSQSASGFIWLTPYLRDAEGAPALDAEAALQPAWTPWSSIALQFSADPSASLDIETTSLYVNDSWRLNAHWSFNVGLRYEDVRGMASDVGRIFAAENLAPRLSAVYDPRGDGRYRLRASYGEYSGRYNPSLFNRTSSARNPDQVVWLYTGPTGVGLDFDPALDLNNYLPVFVVLPKAGTSFAEGLSSQVTKEATVSAGVTLERGGFVELSYVARRFEGTVEDLILIENGTTLVEDTLAGPLLVDNVEFRNSDLARREYRSIQLNGRYRLRDNWMIQGNWTWELKNHGNFVGEDAARPVVPTFLGDYPEILVAERNFPSGRLPGYQERKIRLWTDYSFELGKDGAVDLSLLYNYDSPLTFSLVDNSGFLSETQLARDPGYAQRPTQIPVYFGRLGEREFEDVSLFDLAVTYRLSVWKPVEPWIKVEVRNLFNASGLRTHNTIVQADFDGPVDEHGIPTGFVQDPNFGRAEAVDDYFRRREFLVSLGLRFGG